MSVQKKQEFNSKCVVCGKPYQVCRTCQDTQTLYSWRLNCDTQDCFRIFMILDEFKAGILNEDDAAILLKEHITPQMQPFADGAKRLIDELLRSLTPKHKKTKPTDLEEDQCTKIES